MGNNASSDDFTNMDILDTIEEVFRQCIYAIITFKSKKLHQKIYAARKYFEPYFMYVNYIDNFLYLQRALPTKEDFLSQYPRYKWVEYSTLTLNGAFAKLAQLVILIRLADIANSTAINPKPEKGELSIKGAFTEIEKMKFTYRSSIDVLDMQNVFTELNNYNSYIDTGISMYNELLGLKGLPMKGIVCIAGPQHSGKTNFLVKRTLQTLKASPNIKKLFVSLEMNKFDIIDRFVTFNYNIHIKDFADKTQEGVIELRRQLLDEFKDRLYIIDNSDLPDVGRLFYLQELIQTVQANDVTIDSIYYLNCNNFDWQKIAEARAFLSNLRQEYELYIEFTAHTKFKDSGGNILKWPISEGPNGDDTRYLSDISTYVDMMLTYYKANEKDIIEEKEYENHFIRIIKNRRYNVLPLLHIQVCSSIGDYKECKLYTNENEREALNSRYTSWVSPIKPRITDKNDGGSVKFKKTLGSGDIDFNNIDIKF